MKTKKIAIILIAVAFLFAVLFALFFAFSVNRVCVTFSIYENVDSEKVQKDLDGYVGKNMLFFDTDQINKTLEGNPYIKVVSVKKDFPNLIRVNVAERIEWIALRTESSVIYLSEEGIALREIPLSQYSQKRDNVELCLNGLNVLSNVLGKRITTDDDLLFNNVIEMIKSVNLSDTVKTITVNKNIENNQVVFSVYSGVDIIVQKADDMGLEKVATAFGVYDGKIADKNGNYITDYQKFTSSISVYKLDTGEIRVTFIAPKDN